MIRALKRTTLETGPLRTARLLTRLNQDGGFDCPGCAWPESHATARRVEFCENGAKAVAHEATLRRVDARLLRASTPVAELRGARRPLAGGAGPPDRADAASAPGSDRYEPIVWDEAFARIGARAARRSTSPDEAVFYTSGRTSNEAAFLYQLFVRELGTNNLPDCSNMCHESSGVGLGETIGVGKGTVGLDDFELADAIFVIGQNPGTNHPRMLIDAAARQASAAADRQRSTRCASAACCASRTRSDPLDLLGRGTPLADLYLQVRIGGDLALFKGIMKQRARGRGRARRARVLDHAFIASTPAASSVARATSAPRAGTTLEEQSGLAARGDAAKPPRSTAAPTT